MMTDNLLPQVQAVLSTTAERWLCLTTTIPIELLTRPAAHGEWSALECLQHLLDTERMVFPVRVQAFLDGQDFVAFEPDAQQTNDSHRTPAQLAADFAQHRSENLALLKRLGTQDLARTVRHSVQGPVTLGEMLNEWAAHDLMHTVQAERALMQPFIASCGSWRPFFKDHDVDPEETA